MQVRYMGERFMSGGRIHLVLVERRAEQYGGVSRRPSLILGLLAPPLPLPAANQRRRAWLRYPPAAGALRVGRDLRRGSILVVWHVARHAQPLQPVRRHGVPRLRCRESADAAAARGRGGAQVRAGVYVTPRPRHQRACVAAVRGGRLQAGARADGGDAGEGAGGLSGEARAADGASAHFVSDSGSVSRADRSPWAPCRRTGIWSAE